MVERPRHPKKDIEKVMRTAEARGWRFVKVRKYYKAYCPCGEHLYTGHMTPSNPWYIVHLMYRVTCLICWDRRTR
jgi:hypothetical protein